MPIISLSIPRGTPNWAKGAGLLEAHLADIVSTVNTLESDGVTNALIFGSNTQSESDHAAISLTSSRIANIQNLTMTATSKIFTFPAVNAGAAYDGQRILVENAGSNAFQINDNGGSTLVSSLQPGQSVFLCLIDISTAAGTWIVVPILASLSDDGSPQLGGNLDVNGNSIVSTSNGDVNVAPNGSGKFTVTGDTELNGTAKARPATESVTGITKTLALADANTLQICNNASDQTITIPTNASVAFPTGTLIAFTQKGAGVLKIKGASGVTINGNAEAGGDESLVQVSGQYQSCGLYKDATNTWIATGSI